VEGLIENLRKEDFEKNYNLDNLKIFSQVIENIDSEKLYSNSEATLQWLQILATLSATLLQADIKNVFKSEGNESIILEFIFVEQKLNIQKLFDSTIAFLASLLRNILRAPWEVQFII
jgi:hypothetical protein